MIRVAYSYVSPGTELSSLRVDPALSSTERSVAGAQASVAKAARYLKLAAMNPRLAVRRGLQIAEVALVQTGAALRRDAASSDGEASAPASELDQVGSNIGYSVAGQVIAVGEGIADVSPGDRVAACGAGLANHADMVSVPRNLVVQVPVGVSLQDASAATIGSIALQGVRRTRPELGERVAVIGLGLIGQLTVQLLQASGVRVIAHDLSAARVARALQSGAEMATADADELRRVVRDLTGSHGVDAVLLTAATRSDAPLNLAMELSRRRGRVVLVGDVGLKPERVHFYRKEIDLLMSTSYGPGRYDSRYEEGGVDYPLAHVRWTLNRNMSAFLESVARGHVSVGSVTDRVVPIADAPQAYKEMASSASDAPLGVVLDYGPDDEAREETISIGGHKQPAQGPVSCALVGVGGFGTGVLVPQMERYKEFFFLRGVVSRDAVRGGNYARQNRIEILSSNLSSALTRPELDLFVIATRHHEHAEQVAQCLEAGRSVFVEKPLALSWDQLDRVASAYECAERKFVMVGFNRRFSPAIQKLREIVGTRRGPLVMAYRLHAGYLALDHWVQGPEGGGRNLGEACHMYDTMRFLAGASVDAITAMSVRPGDAAHSKNDNFVATLNYAEGSIGTLTYTALGPKSGLGKERLEVFCDGEAFLLDDFKKLIRQSTGEVLWESAETDKGHSEEMRRVGLALKAGDEAPIPFSEIVETTAVALAVQDQLDGRA